MEFDGKSDYMEIPPRDLQDLVKLLPRDRWYAVVGDNDEDFLITNVENKGILPDLFCELKRRARDE
ncbi:MAG: hypothetical protein ACXQT3_02925 [Methermicoccaceae archaeon]